MKAFLTKLTLILLLISSQLHAGDSAISPFIVQSFNHHFTNARNVTWKEADGLYRAGFTLEGREIFAYFNATGELVVVAEAISIDSVPASLQQELIKKTQTGNHVSVYKLDDTEGITYYALYSKDNRQVTLRSSGKRWIVQKM